MRHFLLAVVVALITAAAVLSRWSIADGAEITGVFENAILSGGIACGNPLGPNVFNLSGSTLSFNYTTGLAVARFRGESIRDCGTYGIPGRLYGLVEPSGIFLFADDLSILDRAIHVFGKNDVEPACVNSSYSFCLSGVDLYQYSFRDVVSVDLTQCLSCFQDLDFFGFISGEIVFSPARIPESSSFVFLCTALIGAAAVRSSSQLRRRCPLRVPGSAVS
jgi:hypothetical protein